jgi:hypothetical protein
MIDAAARRFVERFLITGVGIAYHAGGRAVGGRGDAGKLNRGRGRLMR